MTDVIDTRKEKLIYTARTHTTGGREGESRSDDGRLQVKLDRPGTPGKGKGHRERNKGDVT